MKRISLPSLAIFLILFAPSILAQEGALVENVSWLKGQGHSLVESFNVIVSSNGKMTVNPAPVFTEGKEPDTATLPSLISTPTPIPYPAWAIQQGWRGEFVIALEILADGSVGRYQIMRSTGYQTLDEAATQAVRNWKFHPAVKQGQPYSTCIQIPIIFQLQNE